LVKYPSIQSLEAVLSARLEIPDYDSHLMYTARLCTKDLLVNADLMKQAETIRTKLAGDKIKTPANREIIAMIAYLQRMGTDIKAMPVVATQQ
jgi:cbb3-type cytochrome oxidase cytochrome c subunit